MKYPIKCGEGVLMAEPCPSVSRNPCFICGKELKNGNRQGLNFDIEADEILKPDVATESSGYYPVGPDCIKRVPKEYRVIN